MNPRKLLLLVALAVLIDAFLTFDLGRFFSLDYFKSHQAALEAYRATHPGLTTGIFFIVYVALTGLSLPGAALLTLVAGAVETPDRAAIRAKLAGARVVFVLLQGMSDSGRHVFSGFRNAYAA